jgi:hypothetical protein
MARQVGGEGAMRHSEKKSHSVRKCWAAATLFVLSPALAAAAQLGILAPVLENGTPQTQSDAKGQPTPVLERVVAGGLHDALQREAAQGFIGTMLALDEAAQRAAGAATPGPTWLYLSLEDGGFARRGFWLIEKGARRYVDEPFIDIVVDEASIADGAFEELFAHEMGHVFLRRLLPKLPYGYSRTPHSSLAVTDYPTAFDEGFAIHFQGLARRLTVNAGLRDQELGLAPKPFLSYWASHLDRATRNEGMRRNWFVQAQLAPGVALFDATRLKNANQMLASEGVIATLFYRWWVPGAGERQALLDRYGRTFTAIAKLNERELHPDAPVFLDFVDAYTTQFPSERDAVLDLIVDATYGATTGGASARETETLAAHGQRGDMQAFVGGLARARQTLADTRAQVRRSSAALRAGLAPNLWLLGASSSTLQPSVNLNTAELEELLQLPGLDRTSAERALSSRRETGLFRDLRDFISRSGVDARSAGALENAMRAAQRAGTYVRR